MYRYVGEINRIEGKATFPWVLEYISVSVLLYNQGTYQN
jgi:hypothetical protein